MEQDEIKKSYFVRFWLIVLECVVAMILFPFVAIGEFVEERIRLFKQWIDDWGDKDSDYSGLGS